MQPIEILRNEHGLIRQYLDNLALAVEMLQNDQRPPREFFDKAIQFARTFADSYHHVKEEYVMFVRLAQKQGGAIDGEIEALRHQHETGRNYVAGMAAAMDGYAEGNPIKTSDLLENLGAYIAMLRQHIHREDHVFFPMVQETFSAEEVEQISAEFDKARAKYGESTFEDNHKLVVDIGSVLAHM